MIKRILRKTVSMASLFCFLYLSFTGILLYIMPPGRIAYWADWHILGLNKDNIGQTHITISMLFLILMCLHLWLNWRSIMLYMKNSGKKLVFFTPETTAGLVLACIVFFGTLYAVPPFSTINEYISDFREDYEYTIGNPPYGHAELSSLTEFMDRMNMDSEKVAQLLTAKGYKFREDATLKEIARANGVKPAQIYAVIKPARIKREQTAVSEPAQAGKPKIDMSKYESLRGSGMGMKSVSSAAESCGISEQEALKRLAANGIKTDGGATLLDVSGASGVSPMDVYIIIDTGVRP